MLLMRETVMASLGQIGRICSRYFKNSAANQRILNKLPCLMTVHPVRYNAHSTSITRANRNFYAKSYPTRLVQPDGSTIEIRYALPRKIIKLPLDLSTVSEEERLARLARRKPRKKVVVEQTFEGMYDIKEYSYLWKNNKK